MLEVLGHQGGWDEILYFAIPAIALIAWVRWAERRARSRAQEADEPGANMPGDTDH